MAQAARQAKARTGAARPASARKAKGAARGAAAGKAAGATRASTVRVKQAVEGATEAAAPRPGSLAARAALATLRRLARRAAQTALPVGARAARAALGTTRQVAGDSLLARARTLPIQQSIDVAVPLYVAWDEWMRFEFLPEGTHRVADVERDEDGHLVGRVRGLHAERDWEAEVLDERVDESFAWHSAGGADTSGLVTFHRLSDRLTRIELHLDVVPGGIADAVALVLRVADRRTEAELRRFKANVEALDPDEYGPQPNEEDAGAPGDETRTSRPRSS